MRVQRLARGQAWPRWPLLERFGVDLTRQITANALEALVPRDDVLLRLTGALLRRDGANAALIGPPGSGRRTVLRDLTQRLATKRAPEGLAGRQVYQVDAARVLSGTRYRGELEERVAKLASEVAAGRGRLVVILTGAPLLLAGDAGPAASGVALRQLLSDGGWILPLSHEEWSSVLVQLPEWERLIQVISMPEWSAEAVARAVFLQLPVLANHHGVRFVDEAPQLAVDLARRYLRSRALPGAAVDLLDEAAALARVAGEPVARREELLNAVAGRTGLPFQGVELTAPGPAGTETDRWLGIEAALSRRVLGQPRAVAAVAAALRRARAGLSDPRRPLGSLLCLGPTGVGKTELAEAWS